MLKFYLHLPEETKDRKLLAARKTCLCLSVEISAHRGTSFWRDGVFSDTGHFECSRAPHEISRVRTFGPLGFISCFPTSTDLRLALGVPTPDADDLDLIDELKLLRDSGARLREEIDQLKDEKQSGEWDAERWVCCGRLPDFKVFCEQLRVFPGLLRSL